MTTKLFTLLSPLLLSACAFLPVSNAQIQPGTVIPLGEWARITTPNEPGWSQLIIPNQFAIGKRYDDGATSVLITSAAYNSEETQSASPHVVLKAIAERRKTEDNPNRFKTLEVKNETVRFKGFTCLKYKTLAEDHLDKGVKSADFLYFKTFGYICPLNNKGAIQFEVSERSKVKQFNAAAEQTGNAALETIEFNPSFKPTQK